MGLVAFRSSVVAIGPLYGAPRSGSPAAGARRSTRHSSVRLTAAAGGAAVRESTAFYVAAASGFWIIVKLR